MWTDCPETAPRWRPAASETLSCRSQRRLANSMAFLGLFLLRSRLAIAIAASLLGRRRLWPQSARGFRANLDYLSVTEFIFDVNHHAIRKVAMVIHCN